MKNKKLLVLCMGIMLSTVGLLLWDGYSSLQHNDRAMVETKDHYQHEVHDHNHERQTPPVSNSSSIDFPIQPVPPESVDKDLARLGWVLFRDPNLSSTSKSVVNLVMSSQPAALIHVLYLLVLMDWASETR